MATAHRTTRKGKGEGITMEGWVRGALVDPDGTVHMGKWSKNIITVNGWQHYVVGVLGGIASSSLPTFLALGNQSGALASSQTTFDSTEYTPRADISTKKSFVSSGTMRATYQWAATDIASTATLNACAFFNHSTTGAGSAASIATFASSTKATTQALNFSYDWRFASA